jgi:transcriptional regulator with XRE-family HTH domain
MATDTWRLNLKTLRNNFNINQSYLALQLNKTQQTIGNWESGIGEPNISELIKITNLFGISIDDFIKSVQVKSSGQEQNGAGNIVREPQADYSSPLTMVQTLSLAVRGLDAANILLQRKVTVLEEENTRLKRKK